MTLFFSLLPVYLLGNLHCLGMCGPLVMMLGHHRYRAYYFAGRLFSYGGMGGIAGATGALLQGMVATGNIATGIGVAMTVVALALLGGWKGPHLPLGGVDQKLSLLLLKDQPFATFLFGFFTVALPCGQTVVVFAACAVAGSFWVGVLNGAALAILTSPSLWLSMQAHGWLIKGRRWYRPAMGLSILIVGVLTLLRGLAEKGWISHFVLSEGWHVVLF